MGGRDSPSSMVCAKCGHAVSPSYEMHAAAASLKKRVTLADFFSYGQMRPFQKDVLQQIEAGL
ncbi:MAG: hypothetical protein OK455_10230, partial [Thaumarchaeota archaeon]|nr:hypothetical protein [Nitrososphaerota archaeon]